jgi:hypothetical protein
VGSKKGGSRAVPGDQEPYNLIKMGICMLIHWVRKMGRIWVVLRSSFRYMIELVDRHIVHVNLLIIIVGMSCSPYPLGCN